RDSTLIILERTEKEPKKIKAAWQLRPSAIHQTDRNCRRNSIHVSACFYWRHWTRARIHKLLSSSFILGEIGKSIRDVPSTLGGVGVLACRPLFYLRLLRYTLDRDDCEMSNARMTGDAARFPSTLR
ncbi:MAG: hypothetical protein QF805_23110, partial [Pirellulaceae bacterium]|nr:hypothetical protein [Pirellulaceae bacterium]